MGEKIIEHNGEKIDISKLTDDELISLYKNVQKEEDLIKMLLKKYKEKYPFLKSVEKEDDYDR